MLAALLVALGCLSIPLSSTAWWVQGTVADTDEFVATLSPMATHPDLQDYVTDEIVTQVMAAVERSDVPGPLTGGIEQSVDQVARGVVESRRFERAWDRALRELHPQLIALLSDDRGGAPVAVDGSDTVELRVETLSDAVRDALTDAGVPAAGLLPDVEITVPVATADELTSAQSVYRPIDRWGALFAPLTVVLIAAGIAIAPGRRGTALAAAVGGLLVLLLTQAAVGWGRDVAVDQLPTDARDVGSAATVLLLDPLRTTLWWLALLALLVAVTLGVWSTLVRRRR